MLNYEEIKELSTNYKIVNGNVINNITNNVVLDEELCLKVKSSILFVNITKKRYEEAIKRSPSGLLTKTFGDYLQTTMSYFSINNEKGEEGSISSYTRLVNGILDSNGHYVDSQCPDKDIVTNEKYSLLIEPKKDLFLAYLKLKFREKGLDIDDISISMDSSGYTHTGHSIVTIDYKIKKYEKFTQNQQSNTTQSNIQHPRANELNELEKQKQIAKQNNDEVAYNYAQSAIEKIIRESRIDVASEKWDSMSIQDKIAFVKIKINESKILHDQDEFNYWNANLNSLNAKLVSQSEVKTYNHPSYDSAPVSNVTKNDYQEQEKKYYKYYYQELMKAVERRNNLVNPTETEKKQVVGEIFYNQGFLVESLNTQQEFNEVMNSLVNDLNDNQLQKIILSDMQDRYNSLFKNNSNSLDEQQQVKNVTQEQTELTIFVNQLREKMNKVNAEYKFMLLDGYIDDVELAVLISRTNELIDNTNSLKPLANNQNEVMLLNSISEILHNEQKKMITMQKGIEKIEETRRTL